MTARIIVHNRRTSHFNHIIEDPDVSKKRIFIDSLAYDVDTLRMRPGESFHMQNTELLFQTGADYSNYPPLLTNGKFWWGPSWGRQDTQCVVGHNEPWFASLDYDRLPGKNSFVTSTGFVSFQQYYSYSGNTGLQSVWLGYDMNGIAQYWLLNASVNTIVFYEDPNAMNEFYAIMHYSVNTSTNPHSEGPSLGKLRVSGSGYTFIRGAALPGHLFFVGRNLDNTALFVRINGNTQSMEFYKLGSSSAVSLVSSWSHPGPPIWHYQFPSNIRHDSDSRKVFYQGGWDAQASEEYKNAFFHRFIFNPESGQIDVKPCVLIYPAGKTHNDFQRSVRYEPSYHNQYTNVWYYKPHQFTVDGTRYLTYVYIDKSAPNYNQERAWYYRRDKQNTWITFTVGSGENDHILTYHSTFTWPQNRHYVRYMMPINHIGNQLLVARMDDVATLTFDTMLGWVMHDREMIAARSVGQDSTGRIYIGTTGANNYYDTAAARYDYNQGVAYSSIWEYVPNSPINLIAGLASNSYIYSGTNIQSNITLQARNSIKNTLVEANVRLVMNGTNAKFTDNVSNVIVRTSSSGNITVPFVITGAGRPSVSAHLIL